MGDHECVRDLPLSVKEQLCIVLDQNGDWERIVRRFIEVNINVFSVEHLRLKASPTHKLLKLIHNFKLSDVYVTLGTLELTEAMNIIKPYVDLETKKMVEEAKEQSISNEVEISYIYQLPEDTRRQLCAVLDSDLSWRFLMSIFQDAGFDFYDVQKFQREVSSSPSNELLKVLADRNFKISLLYTALASLRRQKAMSLLESFVSENLRNLIHFHGNEYQDLSKVSNIGNALESMATTQPQQLLEGRAHTSRGFQGESKQPSFFPSGLTSNGIMYRELQVATNGWNEENLLTTKEDGKFYKGRFGDSEVAIKKVQIRDKNHCNKVLEELRLLRLARHRNVLEISRIIEGDDSPCIIYPFFKNKSLHDNLLNRTSPVASNEASIRLTWNIKYNIASGIADALLFLQSYFNCSVVVKSSDVLLNGKMDPLVADICLPCMLNDNPPKDLLPYLPKKKSKGGQNINSFCFGTILLELATGQPANKFLKHPVKFKSTFEFDEIDGAPNIEIKKNWKALVGFCFEGQDFSSVAKAVRDDMIKRPFL